MKKTLAYITVAVMLLVLLGGCQVKTGTVPGAEANGTVDVTQKAEVPETTDAAAAEPSETVAPTEPKPTEPKPTEPKTTTATTAPTDAPTDPEATLPPAETEIAPTEPKATEPKATEPKATEPKVTEPKPTEPKATEPKATEPVVTEPKPTEPKPTEPKPTETKPTEPKPTEPVVTEPPHQHDISLIVERVFPTCTQDGYELVACDCGETRKYVMEADGHDWYLYEMSAQGHYEGYKVCVCGWTTEYTDIGDWCDKWSDHARSFDVYEMFESHGSYGNAHNWVIDVPAIREWRCFNCDAVSLTDPT